MDYKLGGHWHTPSSTSEGINWATFGRNDRHNPDLLFDNADMLKNREFFSKFFPIRWCRTILEWVHRVNISKFRSLLDFRSLSLEMVKIPYSKCSRMILFVYMIDIFLSIHFNYQNVGECFNYASQFMMHWQNGTSLVWILIACEPLLKITSLPRKTRSYRSKLCACWPIMSFLLLDLWFRDIWK